MTHKMLSIDELQSQRNIILPSTYLKWFKSGGQKADKFIGTDIDFPALSELNTWANELLEEDMSDYKLPLNSFVFSMHQGYYFSFFICDGNPNPKIWSYMEGKNKPTLEWSSFSKFANS